MIKWMLIYLLTLLGNVDLYLQLQFPDTYIPESDAYRPLDMQNYDHNRDVIKEFLSFMDEKRGPTRLSAMKPSSRAGRLKKNFKKIDRTSLNFRLLDGESQHKEWRELMRFLRIRDLANMLRICHTPRRNKDRFSFSLGLLCLGKRSRNYQLLCREFGVPVRKVWICKDEIEGLFKFQLRKPDDYERIGRKTFQAFKKKKDAKESKDAKDSKNKLFLQEVKTRLIAEKQEQERKQRDTISIEPKLQTPKPQPNLESTPTTQAQPTTPRPTQQSSQPNHKPPITLPEPAQDPTNDVFVEETRTESEHMLYYQANSSMDNSRRMEINIQQYNPRDSIDSRNFPPNIINITSQNQSQTTPKHLTYLTQPPVSDLSRISQKPFTLGQNLISRLAESKQSTTPTKDQELLHFLENFFIPFYVENNLTDKVLEKYCDNSGYIPDFLCINREPGDNRGPKGTYLFQYVILSQYYSLEKLFIDSEGKKEKNKSKGSKRKKKNGTKKKKKNFGKD